MTLKLNDAGIIGIGYHVPEKILTNADIEKLVDTNDEWITERTGIKERRISAKDEPTSELAYKAAIKALEDAKVSAEELDMIIVATISADCNTPSTACILQEKLGAKKCSSF